MVNTPLFNSIVILIAMDVLSRFTSPTQNSTPMHSWRRSDELSFLLPFFFF